MYLEGIGTAFSGIVLVGYVTEEGLCYLKAVRCGMCLFSVLDI